MFGEAAAPKKSRGAVIHDFRRAEGMDGAIDAGNHHARWAAHEAPRGAACGSSERFEPASEESRREI